MCGCTGVRVFECVSACIAAQVHSENQSGNKWQTKRSILRDVRWSVPHMQMHKRMQIKHTPAPIERNIVLACNISCCHSSSFRHIRDCWQAQLHSCLPSLWMAHQKNNNRVPKMRKETKIVITFALWPAFCTGSSAELQFPACPTRNNHQLY